MLAAAGTIFERCPCGTLAGGLPSPIGRGVEPSLAVVLSVRPRRQGVPRLPACLFGPYPLFSRHSPRLRAPVPGHPVPPRPSPPPTARPLVSPNPRGLSAAC